MQWEIERHKPNINKWMNSETRRIKIQNNNNNAKCLKKWYNCVVDGERDSLRRAGLNANTQYPKDFSHEWSGALFIPTFRRAVHFFPIHRTFYSTHTHSRARSSSLCMVNLETVFVRWIDLFVIVIAKGEDLLLIMCHGADTKEIAKFCVHFY